MALKDLQSDLKNLDFGKGTAFDRPDQGFSNQPFVTSERITKFLITPQGLGFLTKQVGLQASNPKIREGENIFNEPASNQRTYNLGINTLASIAGSAAGIRFKREGLTPLSDPSKFEGYTSDIELTKENTSNNRLIGLLNDHIINVDPTNNTLFEYNGGPDSVYGLGQTTINKYVNTSIQSQFQIPSSPDGVTDSQLEELDALANRTDPGLMGDSAEGVVSEEDQVENPLDKLSKLLPPRNIGGKYLTLSHDPLNTKKQKSKYTKGITSYHVSYNGESDAVNFQPIQEDKSEYEGENDFIPFRFEAVNTDNPLKSDYIIFRAFLDGFNDNYNANHNSFNYNGRGETFYTYNGFTRNIDFSFKIAAQSKVEILPLYTKLNYLVSNVAPEYSDVGRMRTPFIKLTVGDWCNKVPGVLNTIALSWQKDYPWQIKNNENILMLPHVLDVNVQFTPIHQFMPEKSINSQFFNLTGANA